MWVVLGFVTLSNRCRVVGVNLLVLSEDGDTWLFELLKNGNKTLRRVSQGKVVN